MNRKGIVVGVVVAIAVVAGTFYRSTQANPVGESAQLREAGHAEAHPGEAGEHAGAHGPGHEEGVRMSAEQQQQNGVAVGPAELRRLPGRITATGKVEANADRIAHVSPRIPGKVVAVRGSLGDVVAAGQTLATLDSVELGEALSRYRQSRTKLALAQSSLERVKALVEKKIAPRKEILQAETDYQTSLTELHADEERLALYGLSASALKDHRTRPLLPVVSPIGGVITEKHAIVGELADPSKNLYTIADLSSVWIGVDINEKDLAKVHRGQPATVTVGAFPDLKLQGRITYIADVVNEATRTVKARIEVKNPGRKLKPEMFATVDLALAADAPPVLAVPEDAVQELDGKKVLFIAQRPDRFVARTVQPGRSASGMVEIVSGLAQGERYADKGAFLLKSELKKGELEGDGHGH